MAKHNEVGKIGEDIATKWLRDNRYDIIERNYLRKWGEIDIVARETEKIHFVEVKTVSHETRVDLRNSVSHETWRPEDNVHAQKQRRLERAIQTWLIDNKSNDLFQVDIIVVRVVPREKFAQVRLISNVIFE